MKRTKGQLATVVALDTRRGAGHAPRSIELEDGAVAAAVDGGLELRDAEGRLLVRYANGSAEIAVPAGDLVLSAPAGRVVIRAAEDVEIETRGTVTTVARAVATKAESIALTAEKYELAATRIVEKSRDAFRDVVDLAQTRVGRARTVVASIFSLSSRRSVLVSKEDTSIDGRKILLG
jgi:hypothetical protein